MCLTPHHHTEAQCRDFPWAAEHITGSLLFIGGVIGWERSRITPEVPPLRLMIMQYALFIIYGV